MDDMPGRINHEAACALSSLRVNLDAASHHLLAIMELVGSARTRSSNHPAQRWVLTQGRDDIVSTTDVNEAYELMARCRAMADAVVYLEIMAPVRIPMEHGRAKQDPISSFPAADANLPPRADTTVSEGGAAGA